MSQSGQAFPVPFPVSIIINNYNYGRFLGEAIESALAQSYPQTEVIVVDDGSSDNSRAVIASYRDRIVPILKVNGGQASALNAGFAHSTGRAVIFLDADDLLHPDVAERVAAIFRDNAEVVRVQYRLEIIDGNGIATGGYMPPANVAIPSGDLRQQVLLYGDDIPWLPTSGNAFSTAMLQRIFPIPEAPYRICADYYLSNLSPLYGLVLPLEEAGGAYRVHGANNHQKGQLDLQQTRQIIIRTGQTHASLEEKAQQLALVAGETKNGKRGELATLSLTYPANRLISLRLDPGHHPIVEDGRFMLMRRGIAAARQRSDLSLPLRLLYIVWFCLVAIVPHGAARWLAEQFFYPEARGQWFNGLMAFLRKERQTQSSQSGTVV